MLSKEDIRIGDEVALANPNVIGGGERLVVKGLTAVEKLVYCVGGPFGYGTYHIDNLKKYEQQQQRSAA